MTAKPWYPGERGVTQLAGAIGALVNDVQRVRRAWHWDTPRPHTWPELGAVVPPPASDLGWARQEPVRTIRYLIQHGLLLPFTEAMAHPRVEGREWVKELDRPVIFAANHSSHADTSLILHALTDTARDRTVVAAAADYWFKRPLMGNIVSLFLNTFPFSRTGGAQGQLHASSTLLKSGWNLVLFPEGSEAAAARPCKSPHRQAVDAESRRRLARIHDARRKGCPNAGRNAEVTGPAGHLDRALARVQAARARLRGRLNQKDGVIRRDPTQLRLG